MTKTTPLSFGFTELLLLKKKYQKFKFQRFSLRNEIVGSTVKMDVLLEDYNWVDETSDSLTMEWTMTTMKHPLQEEENNPASKVEQNFLIKKHNAIEDQTKKNLRTSAARQSRAVQEQQTGQPMMIAPNEICWHDDEKASNKNICWNIPEYATAHVEDFVGESIEETVPVQMALQPDGATIIIRYKNWGGNGDLRHSPRFGHFRNSGSS